MHILILQGHPDTSQDHLCHALAAAYAEGATGAGHKLREIRVADTPVTLLRSAAEWASKDLPDYVAQGQEATLWADHVAVFFPLWMGGMPAMLQAWIEQVYREGFALEAGPRGFKRRLKGKSAHVIVTMGMPRLAYTLYFGAPGTKRLRRSILSFSGVKPVRETFFGGVEDLTEGRAEKLLAQMRADGAAGR